MDTGITNEVPRSGPRERLEIEYVLREDDYLELARYTVDQMNLPRSLTIHPVLARQRARRRLSFWILTILCPPLWIPLALVLPIPVSVGVFACLAGFLIMLWRTKWRVDVNKSKNLIQQHYDLGLYRRNRRDHVIFEADGFIERTNYFEEDDGTEILEQKEFRVSWGAVERIDSARQHIVIYVRNKGYLIVPPAAFGDKSDRERFLNGIAQLRIQWDLQASEQDDSPNEGIRVRP